MTTLQYKPVVAAAVLVCVFVLLHWTLRVVEFSEGLKENISSHESQPSPLSGVLQS